MVQFGEGVGEGVLLRVLVNLPFPACGDDGAIATRAIEQRDSPVQCLRQLLGGVLLIGGVDAPAVAPLYQSLQGAGACRFHIGQQAPAFAQHQHRQEEVAERGARRLPTRHLQVGNAIAMCPCLQLASTGEGNYHCVALACRAVAGKGLLRVAGVAHREHECMLIDTVRQMIVAHHQRGQVALSLEQRAQVVASDARAAHAADDDKAWLTRQRRQRPLQRELHRALTLLGEIERERHHAVWV
jgi:hypothetical protein